VEDASRIYFWLYRFVPVAIKQRGGREGCIRESQVAKSYLSSWGEWERKKEIRTSIN